MKYWILPWRTTVFDLPTSLNDYGFVEWRQINKLSVGDIVFLYCTLPVSQILYMFRVTKIDIPYKDTINKDYLFDTYNYYLKPTDSYARLEPIAEASENNFELSYTRLNQIGVKSRLQRGISVEGQILQHILDNFDVEYNSSNNTYEEGKAYKTPITSYERNPLARKECIAHYHNEYKCQICGMDFRNVYGEVGRDFIHVHHIYFISSMKGREHKVNPKTDLIPVCPNCHAMLHRKINGKYLSPSELKNIINHR